MKDPIIHWILVYIYIYIYIGDTYDVIICEHLLINLSLLKDNY